MRVLLDEHLPVGLASELRGHEVDTVVSRGWAGLKNGDLLRQMRVDYGVFVTMDRSIEYQQNIAAPPFGLIVVRAASNRLVDLRPLVPAILEHIVTTQPGRVQHVGA